MEQRHPDPFFEALKADIQDGIDSANRGELTDDDVVYAEMRALIDSIERPDTPE